MLIVPTQPTPSQVFDVTLANQQCSIAIYQKIEGLFFDLTANATPIVTGTLCEDRNRIVRSAYLGFVGDFIFVDTMGGDDPIYTGLGTRFVLTYLEAADL